MIQGFGRILIVDDEPSLLKMLDAYLSRLGYSVGTASTTEEAWSNIAGAPCEYALVVLDASMQGLGMHDLAARILSASPIPRVLVASGYPVDVTSLEATAPGRVAFLHKPFTPHMLAEEVRRMLAPQEEGL